MRICLYTETALPKVGGQELVVDALAREFVDQGHETVVLTQPPRGSLEYDDAALPYTVVRHPRFLSTRRLIGWYRFWIQWLHRRWPFDVLHCHSVYPCGYVASLAARRLGVPLVLTSHGGDTKANNPRLEKPGMEARRIEALRAADALIAISQATADNFRRLYAQAARIEHIPNGVDLSAFTTPARRPRLLPPEIPAQEYLLFLGRLKHQKGVDLLLEALAALPDRLARTPLVVAGDGDARAELEALAKRLGLAEHVWFVGLVSGTRKSWLLQNALAVVLPSRTAEAFPLVVLEAAAAGRPVVGTRIPGLADRVADGVTGLLVEPDSRSELAGALAALVANASLRQRLGAAARHMAHDHDWPVIARRHLDLYARLRETGHRAEAA